MPTIFPLTVHHPSKIYGLPRLILPPMEFNEPAGNSSPSPVSETPMLFPYNDTQSIPPLSPGIEPFDPPPMLPSLPGIDPSDPPPMLSPLPDLQSTPPPSPEIEPSDPPPMRPPSPEIGPFDLPPMLSPLPPQEDFIPDPVYHYRDKHIRYPPLELFANSDIEVESFLYAISVFIGRETAFHLICLCHELMFHSMEYPCPDRAAYKYAKWQLSDSIKMLSALHIPLEVYGDFGNGIPFNDNLHHSHEGDCVALCVSDVLDVIDKCIMNFWEKWHDGPGEEILYFSKWYLPAITGLKLGVWVHHLKKCIQRRDYEDGCENLRVTYFLWHKVCSILRACGNPLLPLTDPSGILTVSNGILGLPNRCGRLILKSGNYILSRARGSIILEICPFMDHPLMIEAMDEVYEDRATSIKYEAIANRRFRPY